MVEPTWLELTRRWREIETRFLQYRRPVSEEVIVEESVADVRADFGSLDDSAPSPGRVGYGDELQKLRNEIVRLSEDLKSPQLSGSAFDNFSEQEDKLKVSFVKTNS